MPGIPINIVYIYGSPVPVYLYTRNTAVYNLYGTIFSTCIFIRVDFHFLREGYPYFDTISNIRVYGY